MKFDFDLESRLPEIWKRFERYRENVLDESTQQIAESIRRSQHLPPGTPVEIERVDGEFVITIADDAYFRVTFTEFGGEFTPPMPFIIPAAERERSAFESAAADIESHL